MLTQCPEKHTSLSAVSTAVQSRGSRGSRIYLTNRYFVSVLLACTALMAAPHAKAQYSTIITFGGPPNATSHPRHLIEASDGVLYGTSINGGSADRGTIYKVNKDGSGYTLLHSFNASDGDRPYSVIEGSDGALYGTTAGYSSVNSILYRIDKDGSGYTVLKIFTSADGVLAFGSVTQGGDGALYGVTYDGGASSAGTIFKINHDGSGFTVLQSLPSNAGAPYGALIEASDGKLYGSGARSIFTIKKDGSGFTVLATGIPQLANGLLEGSDGVLYGLVGWQGAPSIIKINKDGSGLATVVNIPLGTGIGTDMVEASDGRLYGTLIDLWPGFGFWFSVNKDGTDLKRDYNTATGIAPQGLTKASDGNLYGTTDGRFVSDGGQVITPSSHSQENPGTIFKLSLPIPNPSVLITDDVSDFSGTQGKNGWYYGDFHGDSTTLELATYNGFTWVGPYDSLTIAPENQHPSVDGLAQVSAVRRWVSYYDGVVKITAIFQIGHNGDGIGVGILVDGQPVVPRTIIGNSGSSNIKVYILDQTIHQGTTIDFFVDPGPARDMNADDAQIAVSIATEQGQPTPVKPTTVATTPSNPPPTTTPPSGPVSGTVLADSVQGFSNTQGGNGWSYGTFYGDGTTLSPLSSSGSTWTGSYDQVSVDATTQHPSATDSILQVSAVRRWTSNYEGTVHVTGSFQIGHDGDGVGVRVLADGQPIVARAIIGNSGATTTQNFDIVQTVHNGTQIDFAVDPGPARDYSGDTTQVAATIKVQ